VFIMSVSHNHIVAKDSCCVRSSALLTVRLVSCCRREILELMGGEFAETSRVAYNELD
jgi:hypothetical protein